jgi:flagellar basal-body rod protein FlgF
MENALLVGLSRQTVLERQLDVLSNNIANVNTNGYKADRPLFEEYLNSRAHEDNFKGADRRVSYVQDRGTFRDMTEGAATQTGNPLDVAVDGKGYFVVQTPNGERYTRNGSFEINATGQLVDSEGNQVLGTGGPITFQLTDHNVTVSPTGIVTVRDGSGTTSAPRGQLQIVGFDQPRALQKDGASTFKAPNGVNSNPAPQGTRVVQGALEKSNVRPIAEMARMIEITRSYSDIAAILQQQGDMKRNSLQQLSQIPSSTS